MGWYSKYTPKHIIRDDIEHLEECIKALEAQVAAADALAAVLDEPLQSYPKRSTYEYRWEAVDDALAAYNEAKKGGA